jgi:hypothetical protein
MDDERRHLLPQTIDALSKRWSWRDADDLSEDETVARIDKISPERAFAEYCQWHGLIGWGPDLIAVLDNLRARSALSRTEGAQS